jgi:pSer/pThr/pTyr-binding forkhead associated (FHA) protein
MADLLLEIVEGEEAGRQLPLQGPVDIGREPNMPLHIDDGQVSRRHARVSPHDGRAVVEDLGSTNGTFVNDQPIQSPRELSPGDRVRIGLTVIELRSAQQVQERPSAVNVVPQITAVGHGVLQEVPDQQLAPVAAPPMPAPGSAPPPPPAVGGAQEAAPGVPSFKVQESPAAYVPPEVIQDEEARANYVALNHLVDAQAKQRRNIFAFAFLGASALAVVLYFGLT